VADTYKEVPTWRTVSQAIQAKRGPASSAVSSRGCPDPIGGDVTATKTRYSEVWAELERRSSDSHELFTELDELIGERMADALDAGARSWRPSANPSFDECRCTTAGYRDHPRAEDARRIHELILGLDGPLPLTAMDELLSELGEGILFEQRCGGFLNGETFESFFAQHNWSDPVASERLGQSLDILARDEGEKEKAAEREIAAARAKHEAGAA